MTVGAVVGALRRKAGLTQRQLAARTGVAQPTIARIEAGRVDPKLGTLDLLFGALGVEVDVRPRPGAGVDRTQIRALLRLTPLERLQLLEADAAGLAAFDAAIGR